jgi:hypothetical protein
VLLAAERLDVATIARRVGISRPAVWRWQHRFAEAGVDGLLRDKSRKPGKAPIARSTMHKVVALTCGEPEGEATHWTGRMKRARRDGDRRLHATASPPGVLALPQRRRGGGPGRQARPLHPR